MSGEHFPKEEQRMCNGASGQVPITGVDRTADESECGDLYSYPLSPVHAELEFQWLEKIARDHVGYGASNKWNDVDRAAILNALVQLYVARIQAKAIQSAVKSIRDALHAIRDEVAEMPGAISENGTDIGAGISLAFEQILKTLTNENTDND